MAGRVELFASAVFGADGTATARTAPVPWGRIYRIASVAVRTSIGLTPRTAATVYRNSPLDNNRVDTTLTRGNGSATDVPVELLAGELLVVVWSGGTPGATASFTASGEG
jgi:hypothetical protein